MEQNLSSTQDQLSARVSEVRHSGWLSNESYFTLLRANIQEMNGFYFSDLFTLNLG